MSRLQSLNANPAWCSICGLPIPPEIVSSDHPLFGTVDHVVPRALGGRNCLENRAPAHRFCNNAKKARTLSDIDRMSFQAQIAIYLKKLGQPVKEAAIRRARHRVGIAISNKPVGRRTSNKHQYWLHLQRWDDDGGAPAPE